MALYGRTQRWRKEALAFAAPKVEVMWIIWYQMIRWSNGPLWQKRVGHMASCHCVYLETHRRNWIVAWVHNPMPRGRLSGRLMIDICSITGKHCETIVWLTLPSKRNGLIPKQTIGPSRKWICRDCMSLLSAEYEMLLLNPKIRSSEHCCPWLCVFSILRQRQAA
mgnify:CR=1 FL=1